MTILIFIAVGLIGLIAHWFKRWARAQTNKNFIVYMAQNRKHSIASVLSVLGAVAGIGSMEMIEISQQTLSMAFLAGYSIDSMVNK